MDLQPALGVIVLLGEGADVDGTRTFARRMVESRPGRMRVWSEKDIEELNKDYPPVELNEVLRVEVPSMRSEETPESAASHVGKYGAVAAWLVQEPRGRFEVTFSDIEQILGFPLPASAYKYPAY